MINPEYMSSAAVEYLASFTKVADCPDLDQPEFAFIGRSNVGKSSLINLISEAKDLAHVSKQPGKTQLINYFKSKKGWYLVDLPGYGYAKVAQKKRSAWRKMIFDYLEKRENLLCTFILIDSNIPPQKIDIEFINWFGEKGIPFVLVYTKMDRLTKREREENLQQIRDALLEFWEQLPREFETSATKNFGKEEILAFIEETKASVHH